MSIRGIPHVYEKILKNLEKEEFQIKDFKNSLLNIRISKKEYRKILNEMVDMGILRRKGRKIEIV